MRGSSLGVGDTVGGRFRLVGEIGEGGMGRVFEAVDLRHDRSAAVKVVARRLATNPEFRERFEREASAAERSNHPHVLPVWDHGPDGQQLYLATPLCDTDLAALISERGRLDLDHALDLLAQVAWALDWAHGRGVVHRDVKPDNILLVSGPSGDHAYLADFGMAKAITDQTLTVAGHPAGLTPAYAAPEQWLGEQVTPAADQYALAATLYTCLAGAPPFEPCRDAELLVAHLRADLPPFPDTVDPRSARVHRVLCRGMAKDPEARFSSCGELIIAARRAANGSPAAAEDGGQGPQADARQPTDPEHPTSFRRRAAAATDPAADESSAAAGNEGGDRGAPPDMTRTAGVAAGRNETQPAGTVVAPSSAALPDETAIAATELGAAEAAHAGTVEPDAPPAGDSRATRTRIESDPVPAAEPTGPTEAPSRRPSGGARTGRRRFWVAGLLLVALIGTAAALLLSGGEDATRVNGPGDDAGAGAAIDRIPVAGGPIDLAISDGVLWVAQRDDGAVARIDASTQRAIGDAIEAAPFPYRVAIGAGTVYVLSNTGAYSAVALDGSSVTTFGPEAPTVEIGVDDATFAFGALWLVSGTDGQLGRYPVDGSRATLGKHSMEFVGRGASGISAGPKTVWVVTPDTGLLRRLDPDTGMTVGRPLSLPQGGSDVAVGGAGVWVANPHRGLLQQIDPGGPRVAASVRVPRCESGYVAVGKASAYYLCGDTGTVTTVSGGRARAPRRVGSAGASAITYSDGAVWVADYSRDLVERMPAEEEGR
jgi:hypothetical protein